MPSVDAAPTRGVTASATPVMTASLAGWGARNPAMSRIVRPASADAVGAAMAGAHHGIIARGMGRSYGDAAQLDGGHVIHTAGLTKFVLDPDRGVVRAEAGVTLGRLLAALAPAGWVLPVVPGTQHVTVGGAIACDIHGKNHASAGTFGTHVEALGLLTADGEVRELTPATEPELLGATIGGLGLTGVILWASIRLARLPRPLLAVDVDRVNCLDDALDILSGPGGAHRVAWLDLLGPTPVRGVVTRADPAPGDAREATRRHQAAATVSSRVRIPPRWPGWLLRPELVRAHNAYRFHRTPRRVAARLESFGAHMFPLDAVDAWPRLYGSGGLVQYQLAVPRDRVDVLERVISGLELGSVPCYLAVLKDFGDANEFPLSFPLKGWTLALDLPGAAPGLWRLLDQFDELVAAARGRVYLAKDVRLRPAALAAMYPRLDEWRAVRDRVDPSGRWRSDLALRTGLVEAK